MALSHKDWELPNSRIWLAEIYIESGLFPSRPASRPALCFEVKKLQSKMQNHWLFSSNNIYFCKCQKADEKQKSKEDEQTLGELNSAHRYSQAKCQLVQTSYINELN